MNLKYKHTVIIVFYIAAMSALHSCKKTEEAKHAIYTGNYGTVAISGGTFKTISIGSQTWTTENIYGFDDGMYHQINAMDVPLPAGWRVPTIADFNKLTRNVSTRKDANGNYIAGPDDGLVRLLRVNISYEPSFFFNGDLEGYMTFHGPTVQHEVNVAGYYMTSDPTPGGYIHDAYLYKLNKDFAGIVYITPRDSAVCASLRFVKDN